jgi:uncharacterized membrane-anchored protein
MDQTLRRAVSKVPEVTLGFWVIKVIATTLGETALPRLKCSPVLTRCLI